MRQSAGSDQLSPTRVISLGSLIRWRSAERSCSLHHLPPQEPAVAPSKPRTTSSRHHSHASVTPHLRIKGRMYPSRNKDGKKSVTILHAVPESSPLTATALLPHQRDTTTQPCQPHRSTTRPTSSLYSSRASPQEQHASRAKVHSSEPRTASPPMEDVKSVWSSNPLKTNALKGAIGVYKHGKIQWRQKDRSAPETEGSKGTNTAKSPRPKIRVVIPSGSRNRPLPALPFFAYPSKTHIVSASIDNQNAPDVSPPSAQTKDNMRDSAVSPLNQPQTGQLRFSVRRATPKATAQIPSQFKKVSVSSSSSHGSYDSDSVSNSSPHSSQTSFEDEIIPSTVVKSKNRVQHNPIISPVVAGISNSIPEEYTRHPVAPSSAPPRRYNHHIDVKRKHANQTPCSVLPNRKFSGPLDRRSSLKRKSSKRSIGRRSLGSASGAINQAISRSSSRQMSFSLQVSSPTLSEAENDLEEMVAPVIPRKSSKRQSTIHAEILHSSPISYDHSTVQLGRERSFGENQKLTLAIPEYKRMTTEDFQRLSINVPPRSSKRVITPTSAEDVILNIFLSLEHFDDLFALAVVNRGFYRVFKRHELELIKSTLRKMSPPAWEFREIAFPGHDMLYDEDLEMKRPLEEYTAATYLHVQKRDIHVIRSIKALIKERCESFVRPEISIALVSNSAAEAARVDDALWRIWTFCKVFGSGKGREDDIVAQQDWLNGGLMVHQQTCTFSLISTDYMNDTLVGAPECFAKGNEGGMTAEQLFDMMELWNCLSVLLQGFTGRTAQAREFGIYESTDIRGGDIDGEEMMLDEWCYHLLTFGLSTVLDLAGPSQEGSPAAFKLAQQNGWVDWKPPVFGGTRRNFLKEAASRVYEDKIAHTYATTSTRDIQRQLSKQRIQKHITELRVRRTNGTHLPMITMSEERPMSEWSTVIGNLTRPRPVSSAGSNIVSHIPTFRSSQTSGLATHIAELPAVRTPPPPPHTRPSSPPRRTVAQPLLPSPPPSTAPSTRDRNSIAMSMPSIEEHPAYSKQEDIPSVPNLAFHPAFRAQFQDGVGTAPLQFRHQIQTHVRQNSDQSNHSQTSVGHPVFQQHPVQRDIYSSEAHENTAEKAIYRIVEMGFTADQAKEALRMTDLGDGLRVDRAVELLLNRGY